MKGEKCNFTIILLLISFLFQIWDWDKGTSNDLLGCVRIGPGTDAGGWDDATGVEVEAWQHLIDNPNEWKEFKIQMRSKTDSRNKKK